MTKLCRFLGIKLEVLFSRFIALSDNCFAHRIIQLELLIYESGDRSKYRQSKYRQIKVLTVEVLTNHSTDNSKY
jgi:hypothetical protein